jgi:uncharacterized spore protein YtfJ
MKMQIEDVLSKVTDFIKSEAKTETVMGKEFKLGEFTCVPVIRIGMGFGYGGGEGEGNAPKSGQGHGEGAGAGAGMGIEPVGFLATRGGEITFIPARNTKGLSAAFEKLPDVLEKLIATRKKPELVA